MSSFAEQKKLILPYLQRADEIQTLDPKVAYYCRLYAIKQGIQIEDKHPDINGVLEALMSKLEQDNKKLTLSDTDKDHCEAFAINVFNRANKQDRSGKADHNTVKAFYVASVFMDILRQFGDLPADMVERQQYAGWKAADIRKALREGRTPTPGPAVKNELGLDLPDIPGSSSMAGQATGQSGDLDLPTPPGNITSSLSNLPPVNGPQDSGLSAGPPGGFGGAQGGPPMRPPETSSSHRAQPAYTLPPHKFMPGNKVYYNAYDGTLLKGTVASYIEDSTGPSYQVALSAKVIDIKEERLAHDFSPGDKALLIKPDGTLVDATVTNLDATQWPVAYLLTLPNGEREPAIAASLSPLVLNKPAQPDNLPPRGLAAQPPGSLGAPPASSQPGFPESHDPGQNEGSELDRARDVGPSGDLLSGSGQPSVQQDDERYPGIDHQGPATSVPHHGRKDPNHTFPDIEYQHQNPDGLNATNQSGFDGSRTGGQDSHMDDAARSQSNNHSHHTSSGFPSIGGHGYDGASTQNRNQVSGSGPQGTQFGGSGGPSSPVRQPPGPPLFQSHTAGASMPGASGSGGTHIPGFIGLQGGHGGVAQPDMSRQSSAMSQAASLPQMPAPGAESATAGLQGPRASYNPSMHVINDAHKVTKTALSALSFEDVPTALKYLNKAIELLTVPEAQK